jgi:hypothetical protein
MFLSDRVPAFFELFAWDGLRSKRVERLLEAADMRLWLKRQAVALGRNSPSCFA